MVIVICPSTWLRVVSLSNHLIFGICYLELLFLQYSKPARNLNQQSHATMDLAMWTRFSVTIAIVLETGERVKLICLA